MYKFDNLLPYIIKSKKLKNGGYYNWQDSHSERRNKESALEFELWVFTKAAQQEAQHNHAVFRQRALAAGFTHMVYDQRGFQFLRPEPCSERELEAMINGILDQQYFDTVNTVYKRHSVHEPVTAVDRFFRFSSNSEGSMVAFREWRIGTYTVADRLGLWKLDTDTRVKGRQNILNEFWQLGFLTLRGRVLTAAVKDFGSKADVLAIPEVNAIAGNLPPNSQLRASLLTGVRKVCRDCDWPPKAFW